MSSSNGSPSPSKFSSAEKRAVHNALERKRRDHIKDMFCQLKDSVPNMAGEKVSTKASRAQILKKACDYIQLMRKKNVISAKDLEELAHQVLRTRRQIAKLESLRATNRYVETLPAASATSSTSGDFVNGSVASGHHISPMHFARPPHENLSYIPTAMRIAGPVSMATIGSFPPQRINSYGLTHDQIPTPLTAMQRIYGSEQAGNGTVHTFSGIESHQQSVGPDDQTT